MKQLTTEQYEAIFDFVHEGINELDCRIYENQEAVYTASDRINYDHKKKLALAGLKILKGGANDKPQH